MTIIDRRYSVAEGTAVKAPCRVATTANITLSGLQTIDGVTVVADDRVLVKNQTTGSENGIYTASTGNWLRTRDFDGAYDIVTGTRVFVVGGSTQAGHEFYVSTSGTITIDSTSIAFTDINASNVGDDILLSYGALGDGTTDDTTAVIAAVAYCITTKRPLPLLGTYLTTATIPNLHDIEYTGTGSIKRGSNLFNPNQGSTGSITIYVATNGNDSNDGLGSSQPMLTTQGAIDTLVKHGPVLNGTWTILHAAGTYTAGTYIPSGLRSGMNSSSVLDGSGGKIIIKGPDISSPMTPTFIVDGTSVLSGKNYAFLLNGNNDIYFEDMLIRNWTWSPLATYGINAADFCTVYCNNVHYDNVSIACIGRQSRWYQIGGLTTGCAYGPNLLNGCTFTFDGHNISDCTIAGLLIAEGCQGHYDNATINNCVVGAQVVEQSHVQFTVVTISNNAQVGVQCAASSSYYDGGVTFSGNFQNVQFGHNACEVSDMYLMPTSRRLGQSIQFSSISATTSETTLYASLGVVPQYLFQTSTSITVKLLGSFGGNRDTRTMRLKADGTTIATLAMPGDGTIVAHPYTAEFNIFANGLAAQLVSSRLTTDIAPYLVGQTSNATTVDFGAADVTLSLTGQCANSNDQITVHQVEVIWT